MKYCVNTRCAQTYLRQADELKVEWRDRKAIPDFAEKYPDKTIVLYFIYHQIKDGDINWEEIKQYNTLCKENFICCLHDFNLGQICKNFGIKFYYGFPIDSFWELNALKETGACYVRLGPSLFFDMDRVKEVGVPVRAVPNVAYIDVFPHKDGACGQWIRPEDIGMYEGYIETCEFEDADVRKEEALFRIYALGQGWPGDVHDLFTNIGLHATNRLILSEDTKYRLNCQHRCQSTHKCHICEHIFSIAQEDKLRKYAETFNL